jgi:hypothetical protein
MDANATLPRLTVPLVSATRCYVVKDDKHWKWVCGLPCQQLKLNPPVADEKEFYILRDFKGGGDGRVRLACSKEGNLAVIKELVPEDIITGRKRELRRLAEEEVGYWHRCGIRSVYCTEMCNEVVLVMPVGFTFTRDKIIDTGWWEGEENPPIENFRYLYDRVRAVSADQACDRCINTCARARLVHKDMAWRHVAIFPASATGSDAAAADLVHYSFIDLSRMQSVKSSQAAKREMNSKKNSM